MCPRADSSHTVTQKLRAVDCLVRVTLQMRDAILKGAHPVNQEEAIKFAAYQCQIQFGDHVDSKHKSGFLE